MDRDNRDAYELLNAIQTKGYITYALHPDKSGDLPLVMQNFSVLMHPGQAYTILPTSINPMDSFEVRTNVDEHLRLHGSAHPKVGLNGSAVILKGFTLEEDGVILHTEDEDRSVSLDEAIRMIERESP